jgi:hypothetical protein
MVNYNGSPPAALAAAGGSPYIPALDSLNTRDVLSGIVAKGYTDLKSDDARNAFAYLSSSLGAATANKLMLHALLFNQRPEMQRASAQQKVQSFYDMGSNDPEVNNIIARAGKVAQGPLAGLQSAPDLGSVQASGRRAFIKDQVPPVDTSPLGAAAKIMGVASR